MGVLLRYGDLWPAFVVNHVKLQPAMLASHIGVPVRLQLLHLLHFQSTWESSGRWCEYLSPYYLYGRPDTVPGCWLQPGQTLAICSHLGSEQQMENSLPLLHSVLLYLSDR